MKAKGAAPDSGQGTLGSIFTSLGDAVPSLFPSWLMNGCNVSEGIKPLLKSLLASGVTRRWRGSQSAVSVCQSSAHRLTRTHIHTYPCSFGHFAKAACIWIVCVLWSASPSNQALLRVASKLSDATVFGSSMKTQYTGSFCLKQPAYRHIFFPTHFLPWFFYISVWVLKECCCPTWCQLNISTLSIYLEISILNPFLARHDKKWVATLFLWNKLEDCCVLNLSGNLMTRKIMCFLRLQNWSPW